MTAYDIVSASIRHVRPMSQRVRAAGAIAMQDYGIDPRVGLHRMFRMSSYARTALIDRAPVAMWGVVAPMLADTALVWLVLAEETGRMPRAIVREARAELQQVMGSYSQVVMTVVPDDEPSIRFALHMGFRPTDGEYVGSAEETKVDPRFRVPIGDRYVIQMCYAPEGAA